MGWMAPLRHRGAKLVVLENHQEWEPSGETPIARSAATPAAFLRATSVCRPPRDPCSRFRRQEHGPVGNKCAGGILITQPRTDLVNREMS
jgi:hypothetical protein